METMRTFVMLKPDAVKRGLIGEIIKRLEAKNYRIVEAEMKKLDPKFLYEHYAHISDQPYFLHVFHNMLSGPVLGLCISGENVINGVRQVIGATKIEEAMPGTIRGDFATSSASNLIHSSDSPETAQLEIERFFGYARRSN